MPERVRQLIDRIADALSDTSVDSAESIVTRLRPLLQSTDLVASYDLDASRAAFPAVVVTAHGWMVAVSPTEVWARPIDVGDGLRVDAAAARSAVLRRAIRTTNNPRPPGPGGR